MEENTALAEAKNIVATETASAQPTTTDNSSVSMETGGVTNDSGNLGYVAIMMLGLASASLIYSIFYYKRRLDALKNGDNKAISQLQSDLKELQDKMNKLTGKKTRNATFV